MTSQSQDSTSNTAARRGFLTKIVAGSVALATASAVIAAPPGQGQGKGNGQGKGQNGKGPGGKGPGMMDPAQLAGRLIQEYDKDGDGALNARELAEALKAMRERRSQMGGAGPQGKGPGGKGKGQN